MSTMGNVRVIKGRVTAEVCFLTFVMLLSLPASNRWVQAGGDDSPFLSMNWVASRFSYGVDLFYSYGPLGFIAVPKLALSPWIAACGVVLSLLISFGFIAAVWLYLRAVLRGPMLWVAFSVCALLLPLQFQQDMFDMRILFALPFLAYVGGEGKVYSNICAAACGALAGIGLYIKFGSGLMCAAVVVAVAISYLWTSRCRPLVFLVASFLLSAVACWTLWGGPASHFVSYVMGCADLAQSYSEAASLRLAHDLLSLQFMAIFAVAIAFLYAVVTRQTRVLQFLVFSAPMLFYSYKHGWVRNVHTTVIDPLIVYPVWMGLMLPLLFMSSAQACVQPRIRSSVAVVVGLSGALLLAATLRGEFFSESGTRTVKLGLSAKGLQHSIHDVITILRPEARMEEVGHNKRELIDAFDFPPHWASRIGAESIDAFGLDVPVLYAHSLRYQPRPFYHAYSSWTEALDSRARDHVALQGPTYFYLWRWGLDDRNPLWESPMMQRELRRSYECIAAEGGQFLLKRRAQPLHVETNTLASFTAGTGEAIPVPPGSGVAPLFVEIDLELSLLGKLMRSIYQLGPVHIEVRSGETTSVYRFIRTAASSGLLLRPTTARAYYVEGEDVDAIEHIQLVIPEAWRKYYADHLTCRFYSLSYRESAPDGHSSR